MKFIAENYGAFGRGPRARVRDGSNVFVNFRGRWEWYVVKPSDPGLEQFAGYVDEKRFTDVLDLVFQQPEINPADPLNHSLPSQRTNDWAKELIPKGERCFVLVDDPERFESTAGHEGRSDFYDRRRSL